MPFSKRDKEYLSSSDLNQKNEGFSPYNKQDSFVPDFSNFSPQAKITLINSLKDKDSQSLPEYPIKSSDGAYYYDSNESNKFIYRVSQEANGHVIVSKIESNEGNFMSSHTKGDFKIEIGKIFSFSNSSKHLKNEVELNIGLGDFSLYKNQRDVTIINNDKGDALHIVNEFKGGDLHIDLSKDVLKGKAGGGVDLANDNVKIHYITTPDVSVQYNDPGNFAVSQLEAGVSLGAAIGVDGKVDFYKLKIAFTPGLSVSASPDFSLSCLYPINLREYKNLSENDILLLEKNAIFMELNGPKYIDVLNSAQLGNPFNTYIPAGSFKPNLTNEQRALLLKKLNEINTKLGDTIQLKSFEGFGLESYYSPMEQAIQKLLTNVSNLK